MWWCLRCAKPLHQKKGCKCEVPDVERIPPLDGFITCIAEGYTTTEEEELSKRLEWFERKRNR